MAVLIGSAAGSKVAGATSPSVRRNVVANYASQFYVMGIGIVMAPVYLSFMGTEAYGLVGFFTMMAAWFQLLDMGMSSTLVRETARFRGGAIGVETLRALLRILEAVFGVVSILGMSAMILLSDQIAAHWLNAKDLPFHQVSGSVMLMGLAVPLRWVSGLYRSLINGFEMQVWLGAYNALVATVRFVGVLGVFMVLGVSPVYFFVYQLLVSAVETAGLAAICYRLVRRASGPREVLSWAPLRGNLAFSLTIAFTATVWVIVTQTDKLILSKWLSLSAFGTFSIAVVAAGAINALSIPFGQALLPRLTKLFAEKDATGVTALYGRCTQAVCVLVAPAVASLAFFAEPVLRAWTGKPEVAHQAAPILCLYAVGNGWVALNSFAYYIQFARGDLRLHFIGNAVLAAVLIPAMIWGGVHFGAFGTGVVWAVSNGLYALVWIPVVHARLLPGHHGRWMIHDVALVVVPTFIAAWLLALVTHWPAERLNVILQLLSVGALLMAVAASGASIVRDRAILLTRRTWHGTRERP